RALRAKHDADFPLWAVARDPPMSKKHRNRVGTMTTHGWSLPASGWYSSGPNLLEISSTSGAREVDANGVMADPALSAAFAAKRSVATSASTSGGEAAGLPRCTPPGYGMAVG